MRFLNSRLPNLQLLAKNNKDAYRDAEPFPHMIFQDFFDEEMLGKVLLEFPDLARQKNIIRYNNHNEKKLAGNSVALFGSVTNDLMAFLNSQPMLEFLQELTGIKEILIPDPYFVGGGHHEIKPGGLLKIHADFNKNGLTGLDRRINLLVYLNKEWEESYGGHFELWDRSMTRSCKKILPIFNTVALFSTTDYSYHGHPDPLACPPDRSRKSLALYYYSNGRPANEVNKGLEEHVTIFKGRKSIASDIKHTNRIRNLAREVVPPFIWKILKNISERIRG